MSTYIPISGLNNFGVITPTDYVALVDSSSLTTYRTNIQAFLDLVAGSGSVISASWASRSFNATSASFANFAPVAFSSSWASRSFSSTSASFADFAPVAFSASFASTTISSSFANVSVSASYARTSSHAVTASYAGSASIADLAISANTASWAVNVPSTAFAGAVPVGAILDFAGANLSDDKYLLCTGSSLSTAQYPELFSVLGYTWGGSGPNFSLPDLRKRMTIGARDSVELNSKLSASVGSTGGGEFYNYHYHIIGTMNLYNDDIVFRSWLGYGGSFSMSMFPPRYNGTAGFTNAKSFPYGSVAGNTDNGTPYTNGNNYSRTGSVNTVTLGNGVIGTSYGTCDSGSLSELKVMRNAGATDGGGVSSGGNAFPNTNQEADLSMPYAVMNKIIRAT